VYCCVLFYDWLEVEAKQIRNTKMRQLECVGRGEAWVTSLTGQRGSRGVWWIIDHGRIMEALEERQNDNGTTNFGGNKEFEAGQKWSREMRALKVT
jgi:hypothetical protein